MSRRLAWRTVLLGALVVGVLASCGDDDDVSSSATTTTSGSGTRAGPEGQNTLELEMVDYGYNIKGKLGAGLATINSTNTGEEWHMAGFARLRAGKTVEQFVEAVKAASDGGGGGEQGDPTAEFIEEEVATPGHVLQPGQSESLTVDVFKPGNYVVLCFIPTEGEGVPHVAKGMVNSFEVTDQKSAATAPKEDAAVTLPDDAEPVGVPTELDGGKRTFKLTASGTKGKDFSIGQLRQGKTFQDFNRYFEDVFEREGGPPKGAAKLAPGTLFGSTFEIAPGQSIWMTVDLPPGDTVFVSTTNTEGEGAEEEGNDKFVTVRVT